MVRQDAFRVEGAVIEVITPTRCWVRLPNGHRVLAYLPERLRASFPALKPGDNVRLKMSPHDLSTGRMIAPEKETNEA